MSDRFFESTRGRVAQMLRRGPATVEELATALDLSANAVRAHLATLERDGLIHQAGVRRGGGVGKPATIYELRPDAAPRFSRAHAPMLRAILDELSAPRRRPPTTATMRAVGRRLALALGAIELTGAAGAVAVLERLGAETQVESAARGSIVRGCGDCPLADAVVAHPVLCRAVEAALAEAAGTRVSSVCEHGERPRCAFEIAKTG